MSKQIARNPSLPNSAYDQEGSVAPANDRTTPLSIWSKSPGYVREAIDKIPERYLKLTVQELRQEFSQRELAKLDDQQKEILFGKGKRNIEFDELDERLRISFWREYEDSMINENSVMLMARVMRGICNLSIFKKRIDDPLRLAYILTAPNDYVTEIEELLYRGLRQMREIMELPLYMKNGDINSKLAGVKVRAIEMLLDRARGAVAQRIESKNLNWNVETETKDQEVSEIAQLTSMTDVDRKIRELTKEIAEGSSGGIIDVTPKEG